MNYAFVMPGLVPGIHVLLLIEREGVDGRDKPGHDAERGFVTPFSAGAQHGRPIPDHLRLARQRDRGRRQDHQRLGAEDRDRQIEAGFRAVKSSDDGA